MTDILLIILPMPWLISLFRSLKLKKGDRLLVRGAAVSIIRFDNTGPWSLLDKMRLDWRSGSLAVGIFAALLSLTTLDLQFASTALLSQVGIAFLPAEVSVPKTYYSTDPDGATFASQHPITPSYLGTTPNGYPAFAEWISNATPSSTTALDEGFAPSSDPGMRDTGTVMRAFLPLKDSNERGLVTEYHGYGTVVDTRVVCVRSKLSNVGFTTGDGYRVAGLANIEQNPLGLIDRPDDTGSSNFSVSFDYGFSAANSRDYSELKGGWPLTLCSSIYSHSRHGTYLSRETPGYCSTCLRKETLWVKDSTFATPLQASTPLWFLKGGGNQGFLTCSSMPP